MAMGLPTIAINWSGNLEFMKPSNSYLIEVESLVEITSGPFKNHKWAQPSVSHLQSLMRNVYSDPESAKAVGQVAKEYIRANYTPKIVGEIIFKRLMEIADKFC